MMIRLLKSMERWSGYRYTTDWYTDRAERFIRGEIDQQKPWYLGLCYGAVHDPSTRRETSRDLPDVDVPVPENIFPATPEG